MPEAPDEQVKEFAERGVNMEALTAFDEDYPEEGAKEPEQKKPETKKAASKKETKKKVEEPEETTPEEGEAEPSKEQEAAEKATAEEPEAPKEEAAKEPPAVTDKKTTAAFVPQYEEGNLDEARARLDDLVAKRDERLAKLEEALNEGAILQADYWKRREKISDDIHEAKYEVRRIEERRKDNETLRQNYAISTFKRMVDGSEFYNDQKDELSKKRSRVRTAAFFGLLEDVRRKDFENFNFMEHFNDLVEKVDGMVREIFPDSPLVKEETKGSKSSAEKTTTKDPEKEKKAIEHDQKAAEDKKFYDELHKGTMRSGSGKTITTKETDENSPAAERSAFEEDFDPSDF